VSITAITGHTLLKLVGGQVVHELNKNGLAVLHPSLSAIGQGARRSGVPPARGQKSSNRKIGYSSYRTDSTVVIKFRNTLAGQQYGDMLTCPYGHYERLGGMANKYEKRERPETL
jgi:hypothetical protein